MSALLLVNDGTLRIGTEDAGLNRWDGQHFVASHAADGLPSESITASAADGTGALWIGTTRGLVRWESGKFSVFFVQAGSGINQTQYLPVGPTCGDGASLNQTCFLVPNPGFKTLESINQLNGPRTFQFALRYRF